MALSDITNKIESDASEKVAVLEQTFEAKITELKKELDSQKKDRRKAYDSETESVLTSNKARVEGQAKRESKNMLEATRRELLDGVFTKALSDLQELDESKYEKVLESLVATLKGEEGAVTVHAPKARLSVTEKAFKAAGIKASFEEDDSIKGGFKVQGEGFEYDLSFTHLIAQKKEELEIKVADILFS